MKPRALAFLSLLLILLLPACTLGAVQHLATPTATSAQPVTPLTQEVAPPTATPTQEVAPPTATPTPDPLAACPAQTESTVLVVNRQQGYCLLYPADLSPGDPYEAGFDFLSLRGMTLPTDRPMGEVPSVNLWFGMTGLDEGMDAAAYATRWQEVLGMGITVEGLYVQDAPLEAISLAGGPAVLVRNAPSMLGGNMVFVVANGYRYFLRLVPSVGEVSELDEQTQRVWDTVTQSLVFFPPQDTPEFIQPEAVCPQPSAESRLELNLAAGYCVLVPLDFTTPEDFMAGFYTGGPVVMQHPDFGEVRTSLAFGSYGYWGDQTPSQAIADRLEFIDAGSIQDVQVGGAPAVIYVDHNGAWPSRQALIISRGWGYTILAQPYGPDQWPAGMDALQRGWDTALGSIAFFTPWR